MIEADAARAVSAGISPTGELFCPECGQSLTLRRSQSEPVRSDVVSWRSLLLVAAGLYLLVAFGLDAWYATRTMQYATKCPEPGWGRSCLPPPRDLTLAIASGRVGTANAFAARSAELGIGRDSRFVAVGLVGLVVGLGAALLRAKRSRVRQRSVGVDVWLAGEGLVALWFGQLVAICAFHVAQGAMTGAPFSLDILGSVVDRALSMFFALAGIW